MKTIIDPKVTDPKQQALLPTWHVKLGHDEALVRASGEERAERVFKEGFGIIRSKHDFETTQYDPAKKPAAPKSEPKPVEPKPEE